MLYHSRKNLQPFFGRNRSTPDPSEKGGIPPHCRLWGHRAVPPARSFSKTGLRKDSSDDQRRRVWTTIGLGPSWMTLSRGRTLFVKQPVRKRLHSWFLARLSLLPGFGKQTQFFKIAGHKGFFLGSGPSLHLSFSLSGFFKIFKRF
jgi:hypothetical protein